MPKEYRIVRDGYCGYEVQARRWWFPFWIQCSGKTGPSNTHGSVEAAEKFAADHAAGRIKVDRSKAVKYLGKIAH